MEVLFWFFGLNFICKILNHSVQNDQNIINRAVKRKKNVVESMTMVVMVATTTTATKKQQKQRILAMKTHGISKRLIKCSYGTPIKRMWN